MSKQKHAAIIHEWADGAAIQFKNLDGKWKDLNGTPSWLDDKEYRVKPAEIEILYRRYITTDCFEGVPSVFCLSFDKRETYFPDHHPGFIRWIDAGWLKETIPAK